MTHRPFYGLTRSTPIFLLRTVEKNYNYFEELLWMRDHGLEIQYKSMSFEMSGCAEGEGCENTVWLGDRCVHRSELGNIMLGFWAGFLDHTERELLAGGNWVDMKHPGEGPNNAADVGGLAYGYFVGSYQIGRYPWPGDINYTRLPMPPYDQKAVDAAFTPGKWREGFRDPKTAMAASHLHCKKCDKTWIGRPHPPISPERKK